MLCLFAPTDFHGAFPEAVISGTVRSVERRDAVLSSPPPWLTGDVHVLDIDDEYAGLDERGLADLLAADTVVQTVAPIADFDRDPLLTFHGELLASGDNAALRYVACVSSTGVYGDHGGEWVAEGSELLCTDAKSLARIRAENEWGSLERQSKSDSDGSAANVRVDCFRCGGIYGPGRGPLYSTLESLNQALSKEASGEEASTRRNQVKYVNRIHVDDLSGAIVAARTGSRKFAEGGRAYNLVDDDPAPRAAVVAEARRLMLEAAGRDGEAIPPPSKVATSNTRRRISRGTGNKRCDNSRLKSEYDWRPRHTTFREGLASLLEKSTR